MSETAIARAAYSPKKSGSSLIDGLLAPNAWGNAAITYAFPTSRSAYSYSGEPNHGFKPISADQKAAARFALDAEYGNSANNGFSVEGFTGLDLSPGAPATADIRIAVSRSANPTAYAYYPSGGQRGGDVWFGTSYDYSRPEPGDYAFLTMLHELGHALGLKHGHLAEDGRPRLPSNRDSLEFSVMTYRTHINGAVDGYVFEPNGAPQSYMMADIAALQYLYGADFSTNAGDTVYAWSPGNGKTRVNGEVAIAPSANRIFATIWDGGGTDTYDLSAYSTNLKINLAPGGYSVFRGIQLADLGGGPHHGHARGNIFNALLFEGDLRSLIENAIGGAGNDRLKGNIADNMLEGGNGADRLFGKAGDDTLIGGARKDILVGGAGGDHFVFAAGNDIDVIRDFQDDIDLIHLDGFGLASVEDALALAHDDGFGNVIFEFGSGDTLLIIRTAKANLTDADIVLG